MDVRPTISLLRTISPNFSTFNRFRPHRTHAVRKCTTLMHMLHVIAWSVVTLLGTPIICAETAEPIKMLFWEQIFLDSRNRASLRIDARSRSLSTQEGHFGGKLCAGRLDNMGILYCAIRVLGVIH